MSWSRARVARCVVTLSLALGIQPLTAGQAFAQSDSSALLDEAEQLSKHARELDQQDNIPGAIEAVQRALDLQEQQLMPRLPEAAQPMFRLELTEDKVYLVSLYARSGDLTRARELLAAEISFHEAHADGDRYAGNLDAWRGELATLDANIVLADVQRAMELHQQERDSEALVILQSVLPKVDASSGIEPGNLAAVNLVAAEVLSESFLYAQAEARYQKALEYGEQAFGSNAPELLKCLGELGRMEIARGTPERGAKYFVRAHEIAQSTGSASLPDTVRDLGTLLWHRNDNEQAIRVLERAIQLYDAQATPTAAIGKLAARLILASVQDDAGKHDEAELSYLKLGEEIGALGSEPWIAGLQATYLHSHGVHYLRLAQYGRAEHLLLEASRLSATFTPADSPLLVQQGCDLGEVYWAAGDLARSLDPIGRCFDSREQDISRVLATGTEEQKRAFLGEYLVAFQKTMNAQRLGGNDNVKLNRLALTQVLRTKGRVLDAMTSSGLAVRATQSEETRALMQRLTALQGEMANLSTSGTGAGDRLKALRAEAAEIENKLNQGDDSFKQATQPIDIPAVQAKLGADDALLEIVEYRPLDAHYQKAEPGLRYLAYVLQHEGEPRAFDLGDAASLDQLVLAFRDSLRHPDRDALAPGRALYARVLQPVQSALGDKKHVFVAPDGTLSAVPFAALVNGSKFLLEDYDFTYLTSGRELLRLGDSASSEGQIVAFADPNFGVSTGQTNNSGSALAKAVFPALPGTHEEADALAKLFPSATLHTGDDASEAQVKQVSRPLLLHLATHGFFLPVQSMTTMVGPNGEALDPKTAQERLAVAQNPLLRSGLAFAGATGLQGQAGEDGVLTALEASSLDLRGTELVVLSACQTAEGETSQGEGVYGLRRALTIAGAKSLVMSLWSVDDNATSYLMRGYYRRLKDGMGRSAALRDVQLVLEHSAGTHHPYYWAAFIPSGDPTPINFPAGSVSGSSDSSGSSSGSSDDDDDDDDDYDDESWPTATPSLGEALGVVRLSIEPHDARPSATGFQGYGRVDFSLLSLGFSEEFGNESRGFVIYDQLGLNLGLITFSGDTLGALNFDYSLLWGYRGKYIGVLGGARYGSGIVAVSDGPHNSGPYLPLAARIEFPWFADTRISALGYYGALGDKRKVSGVDLRIPLFDPSVWLQTGFTRSEGRPDQNSVALTIPITIGFNSE